ncbi:hypothetical protein V8E51_003393 [Hyaloscypha variabilis]|uniref:Glutaredoxin-like protein n=1 Tax=Hyaloscypha variabilis (strain UAMH 11265 / GT02V1 / F) TaxID=1149755 RepID=A0A2J6SCM7_HYAVF|nr:hypothetical protein L207DRAFT_447512 [Hyaloscypha variabilis F]
MFPTVRLLQHACQITLFTRANCSLCTKAKETLSSVWDVRPFEYKEIDVMKPEGKCWRDLYEFDTPVIHINSSKKGEEVPELASKAKKLMHRFSPEEVKAKMDDVESQGV